MLTIAALGSTAPIALDSSEILQLKGLIAAERSVFAGSAGRKLQHASKKVTEGVDASKKSATSQQPKTKADSIVRPPVQVTISKSDRTPKKTDIRLKNAHIKNSMGGNSAKKAVFAKKMKSSKTALILKAALAKKVAATATKKTKKLIALRNKKIMAKVDATIKAEKKASSKLLVQAQGYREIEMKLRAACKKDEAAKDTAILKKNGQKFYSADKAFKENNTKLLNVEAKLKGIEEKILVGMGKMKDAMATINKARGTDKHFVSMTKKGWNRGVLVLRSKYRKELAKTIKALAKAQAFYTAATDQNDDMSVALKDKMAGDIVGLKKEIEFLFKRFLKASERAFSLSAAFPKFYKSAKQNAFALRQNRIPNKLDANTKKAVKAKKTEITIMKKTRIALAKKHKAIKAKVTAARAQNRKNGEKAKKAELNSKAAMVTLKKLAKKAEGVTVNKLVAAKTGKKVVAKTSKKVVAKALVKKPSTSKKVVKLSSSQKKLNKDMKKRERIQNRSAARNQKKAYRLKKKISVAAKKLRVKKDKATASQKQVSELEALEKQFDSQQQDLKNKMKSLSSEINEIKNDEVNYAVEVKGTKSVDVKKAYRVAKAKFGAWKKKMAKLNKRLAALKANGKNEKKIKMLTYKVTKGKKRLARLESEHAKATKAMTKIPEAKGKKIIEAFKKASGKFRKGFKKPTKVITPVTNHTNKAIQKVNSPLAQPLIKIAPAKKSVVKGSVSAKSTTASDKKASTPKRKLSLTQIAAGQQLAENVTQSILGASGMM